MILDRRRNSKAWHGECDDGWHDASTVAKEVIAPKEVWVQAALR
jgi:hypothetical protein